MSTVTRPEPEADSAGLVTRLYRRFRGILHELGKFGVVGVLAFATDTILYAVFLGLGLETTLAKTISTAIAATCAFLGNRFWTWRDRPRTALHREYLLYFLFNLIGLGITLVVLWITHYLLGGMWPVLQSPVADLISGQIVGNAAATVFRFWAYRRFVFAQPQAERA
ncbi:GtrA family protein [Hamadaea tsunoensis]|uniref:GtrA family protein n=1 Tax=Hamadaea tsunoensis TaxID=53368 RepID=UPI0006844A8C|nr:GtrA family protein [Hamadaea tsunoensis]